MKIHRRQPQPRRVVFITASAIPTDRASAQMGLISSATLMGHGLPEGRANDFTIGIDG